MTPEKRNELQREFDTLSKEAICSYLLWEIETNKISPATQNQLVNSIKYYFDRITIQ